MADLLSHIEERGTRPRYILYNIVVLMGKPTGGTRPIALMPMIYRVRTKVRRPHITRWAKYHEGPRDAAIRGSSPLRAALNSQLLDEVGRYKQGTNGTILFDMEKFYDNISITKLMMLGLQHGYPRRLMSLGLQMHMACRGLKCYNTHPSHTMPTNGIMAGCAQSTTFAKVLLMDVVQTMYTTWEIGQLKYNAQVRTSVDDIVITCRGPHKQVIKQYHKGLPILIKALKELGYIISTKTAILGSSKMVRHQIYRILLRQKVKAQIAQSGKDLGVLTTAGGRRLVTVLSKRVKAS